MGLYGSPNLSAPDKGTSDYAKVFIFCSKCGFQYSKKIKKCPRCNKKYKQPFYNKWWFWLFVVFLIFAFYPHSENILEKQTLLETSSQIESLVISETEYKASCVSVNYNDIARNPSQYVGKRAMFKGQVVQVQENGANVILRMNVTQREFGLWGDTIYIDYKRKSETESRILEGDILIVYGVLNGIKDYQAIFGNQISIPHLLAQYVEIY